MADIAANLPGEGLWVRCNRDAVTEAIAQGILISRQDDLQQSVERLLKSYCLDLLGLAKKSGLVIAGYEKVRILEARGEASLLLEAGDSAACTRGQTTSHVTLFSRAELSAIIGEQNVVHMALKAGKLTSKLRVAMKRLTFYTNAVNIHQTEPHSLGKMNKNE